MNKPHFWRIFFLTYWRHKRLKNTIDLLLFYGELFYGFSQSVLCKGSKNPALEYEYWPSNDEAIRTYWLLKNNIFTFYKFNSAAVEL